MKIIAESAFNHNGSYDYLCALADAAKIAGADYFTVQVYRTEDFCTSDYSKYNICKETELSKKEWKLFFRYCQKIEMPVIPCVLDNFSFHLAVEQGFRLLKIHATDMLNDEMLMLIVTHSDVRILLETQCATKRDINYAVKRIGKQIEALFHGFSNYPTDKEDLQLNAIDAIRETWPFKTGLADHSLDTVGVPLIALAKGASYLEKHITVRRVDRHYDYQVSLEPEEFAIMVEHIKKYQKALGATLKHPVPNELFYRDIMYKKYVEVAEEVKCLRSDVGLRFYEYKYGQFAREKVIVSVIARLKSQRLQNKVLLPVLDDPLLFNMIKRLGNAKDAAKVYLATSHLDEDRRLVEEAEERGIKTLAGDPLSVLDRMLDIAEAEEAGAIVRVTGDNPLTDPGLIDEMIQLYLDHDLDYVRVNNLPFGISAELFSSTYLAKLYQRFNPNESEYLTWFVMLDEEVRKGCLEVNLEQPDLKRLGFSVDYQEDYQRLLDLLNRIGKKEFAAITLHDVLSNVVFDKLIDLDSTMKLPGGQTLRFGEYFDRLTNMNYVVRQAYEVSL